MTFVDFGNRIVYSYVQNEVEFLTLNMGNSYTELVRAFYEEEYGENISLESAENRIKDGTLNKNELAEWCAERVADLASWHDIMVISDDIKLYDSINYVDNTGTKVEESVAGRNFW